ncbi:MAG: D-Ala-D-Ala carboxypeptidase family metallohydrolase [Thermodesulfobacteriota bacterium]
MPTRKRMTGIPREAPTKWPSSATSRRARHARSVARNKARRLGSTHAAGIDNPREKQTGSADNRRTKSASGSGGGRGGQHAPTGDKKGLNPSCVTSEKPPQPEPMQPAGSSWEHVKHFTPREFTCKCEGLCDHVVVISPDVVAALDRIRDELGVPLSVVSGTRCERFNLKVGGSPRSAHLPKKGMSHAVDILCKDAHLRHSLISAALAVFPRIGIGKDFVHLDADPELPRPLIWVY